MAIMECPEEDEAVEASEALITAEGPKINNRVITTVRVQPKRKASADEVDEEVGLPHAGDQLVEAVERDVADLCRSFAF